MCQKNQPGRSPSMKLYNKVLMDHYHNPKNYQKLECPTFDSIAFNPLCGDKIYLELKLADDIISEIGFRGEGCIISLATASMLFEIVTNRTIKSIELLSDKDVLDLIKLELGLNRLKCAILPLEALKAIAKDYKLKFLNK